MSRWKELALEIERLLRLKTFPIAYKRFETATELDKIAEVRHIIHYFTFCQLTTLVRTAGWTIGVKKGDPIGQRCARIHGLARSTKKTEIEESCYLTKVWFASGRETRKQLQNYTRIPPGEALALSPLKNERFDPDVVLVYGTPAQVMLLINGLQWKDYEPLVSYFIGEGSCADALARCYISGKASLTIPCYGERKFGHTADDELVLGLPPHLVEKAVHGMQQLANNGIRYPFVPEGVMTDLSRGMSRATKSHST